ncbi:unnamed protein product [Cladocopium goreaui]|uniref:Integrase catalytic domain-containing protein n=1 Tax=Cladocopium goreaui TaxID=2562237 RepID=A0A9P1FN01_9DINO|nr:unnamed protein product [Cladocopium goreaui]
MDQPVPPSSQGSDDALGGRSRSDHGQGRPTTPVRTAEVGSLRVDRSSPADDDDEADQDDGFDSEEFRAWMRNRGRQRGTERRRHRTSSAGSDGYDDGRTNAGPAPEWDGESLVFQDYVIKARLWLATTRSKPRTRGPLLLSKLSKTPFETMKFLAKDSKWMQSDTNGEELINMMDLSEYFGDDRDEDLLSALAKVTYHVRREKNEAYRTFFNRWESAYRKVTEHKVQLPDKYIGFLLIQALCLNDQEIKSMMNFTHGSIMPKDIKEWVRKHETKLQVNQVGVEKKNVNVTKGSGHYMLNEDETDLEDEEIFALETAIRDLQDGEPAGDLSGAQEDEGNILEEHEAVEILSTMLSKKRNFAQSQKAKKAKELGRGYHNSGKGRGKSFTTTTGGRQPFKSGQYRMTIEEVKKVTKCGHCHKVGHWHRECPDLHRGSGEKEQHYLQSEEATFCGMLEVDGKEQVSPMRDQEDQLSPGEAGLSGRGECEAEQPLSKTDAAGSAKWNFQYTFTNRNTGFDQFMDDPSPAKLQLPKETTTHHDVPPTRDSSDGVRTEEIPSERPQSGNSGGLVSNGPQIALCDGSGQRASDATASNAATCGSRASGLSTVEDEGTNNIKDIGYGNFPDTSKGIIFEEHGRLRRDLRGEWTVYNDAEVYDTKHGEHCCRTRSCDRSSTTTGGASTAMRTSRDNQALCVPQTGAQLQEDLLAMPTTEGIAVCDLHLERDPAVPRPDLPGRPGARGLCAGLTEINVRNTSGEHPHGASETLSSHQGRQERDQPVQDHGEVRNMWQGTQVRENRAGEADGGGEESQEDRARLPGVPRVEEIWSMSSRRNMDRSGSDTSRQLKEETMTETEDGENQKDKGVKHVLNQAQTALGETAEMWQSKLAQEYPKKLVDTILGSYARSLKQPLQERVRVVRDLDFFEEIYHTEMVFNAKYDKIPPIDQVIKNDEDIEYDKVPKNTMTAKYDEMIDTNEVSENLAVINEEGLAIEDEEKEHEEEDGNSWLPRERPLGVEQLVRRAHCGLGHLANARLARILHQAGARKEAVEYAKNLKCDVCQRHRQIAPARAAAPPRELTPNQIVGVDTIYLPGLQFNGKRKMALNIIDWATKFQLVIPLHDHTPRSARQAFLQWTRIFGTPERVYDDLGKEFRGCFEMMMDQDAIFLDPGSLESPTQRSLTERAGRTYKEVFSKTLMEVTCNNWDEWHEVVDVVTATINRLANKSGYSPIQRMLGYSPRIPGSLMSGGFNDQSTASRYAAGDLQVQRSVDLRTAAAIAYHKADCEQALRNSLHAGPRVWQHYEVGQTVYYWKKGMEPIAEEEKFILTDWIQDILDTKKKLKDGDYKGYIVLDEKPPDALDFQPEINKDFIGPLPPQAPRYRLTGKHRETEVEFQPDAYIEKRRRLEDQEQKPELVLTPRSLSIAPTTPARTEDLEPRSPNEEVVDSEMDMEKQFLPEQGSERHAVISEESNQEAEDDGRGQVRHGEHLDEDEERPAKRQRAELLEMMFTQLEQANMNRKRKEINYKTMDKKNQRKFDKAILKEIKNNLQSGAYQALTREESEQIRRDKPDLIMKSRYVLTEKPVEPHEVEPLQKEGLLLDNNEGEVLKAKARHVMKGYSEANAEDLESTTPQVAKDTVFFVLQILASMKWIIGHLDFTQAFHSGDKIARELYCSLPPEGVPGLHDRMGKYTTGSGKFTGKMVEPADDGSILIHQKHYIEEKINVIKIDKARKRQRYSQCTPVEINQLRTLLGGLSWVAKETRPDIAGKVAILQQTMPNPMIKDIVEANQVAEELKRKPDLGIRIQPIPMERLRVGVITDASWGNAGERYLEDSKKDYWEETKTSWIRHHVLPRRLLFHPGAAPGGPDLHTISRRRTTTTSMSTSSDEWDGKDGIRERQEQQWTGRTTFIKSTIEEEVNRPINERFLQLARTHSQGGYLLVYYDANLEVSEQLEMMTIAAWKSYKLKRCTVNTLSAECQSMIQGIGNLHWHRFLLTEISGGRLNLDTWEQELHRLPFIAVTDSKSLYDTVNKCRNTSAHIDDKRTAIDLTILKDDLEKTKGQVLTSALRPDVELLTTTLIGFEAGGKWRAAVQHLKVFQSFALRVDETAQMALTGAYRKALAWQDAHALHALHGLTAEASLQNALLQTCPWRQALYLLSRMAAPDVLSYALAFGDGCFASEVLVKAQHLAVAQLKMAALLRSTWGSYWFETLKTSQNLK